MLLCCGAFSRAAAQQINPDAFVSSGSTSRTTGNCFQLTGLATFQTAGLFYNNRIQLSQDFDFEFDINFGDMDQNGADGLAFVLQNVGTNPGQSGEGLGYQGLNPSLAVEFDTWQNGYDPAFDHIGLQRSGNPNHNLAALLPPVMASANSINIEDGLPHRVRLQWVAATKNLRVSFDNSLRLTLTEDLVNTTFAGNATVYWGFTAATGGSFNIQTVCLVKAAFQELLKADVAATNALCPAANNGSITVAGKGGLGPYQYSIDNGASFQASPVFNNLAAGSYPVRVKDAANTLSPAETTVITEPTSIVVTTTVTPGCFGAAANRLLVAGSGGTAPYTFSIDGGATYQASGLYPSLAAGSYQLRVRDRKGCVAGSAIVVASRPETTTGITGADRPLCLGEAVVLNRQGAAIPGATFAWSPAPGLGPVVGGSATVRPTTTTTYTLTTTTPEGCSEQDQVTVIVNPEPAADAGPDVSFCSGSTITLGSAALAGYTYQWAPHPGLSATGSAAPTFSAVNTGTRPDTLRLSLTATHNGCSKTDEVRVVLLPVPGSSRIGGSASVCPGVSGVTYAIVDPAAAGYHWEVSGGTIVAGQDTRSITVNWGGPAATAGIKATGVTPYGCPLPPLLLPVRINPLLVTPRPAGPTLLCTADAADVLYQTQSTNGSVYSWTVVGGTLVAPTLSSRARIKWDTGRRGKVVVTESSTTNLAVCFGTSDTLYVDFNASPDAGAGINGAAAVCAASRQVGYTLTGLPGSTFRWTLDGSPLASVSNAVALDFNTAGTHTLSVVETTSQGCVGPVLSKTITIHPLPTAKALTGPADICPEELRGHVYALAGLPQSTYAWTVTGGTIRSGQGTPQIVADFDLTATKTVTVLETSASGCTSQWVSLSPRYDPTALSFTGATNQEQDPKKNVLHLRLGGNTPGGNAQPIRIYRKEVGGTWGQIAEVTHAATDYVDASAEPGRKAYFYRVENANNCGTILTAAIHKTMLLTAQADEGRETVTLNWNTYQGWPVQGYQIYRKLDQSPDYSLYQTVAATDSSAVFISADEGFVQQFRIKALGAEPAGVFSWSNEATATFGNVPAFYNIFTPDGDSRNETFYIDNVHLYPDNELTVYNRYGKEVFRQKRYNNTWKGEAVTAGTYYYLFTTRQGQSYKGWVEIVK